MQSMDKFHYDKLKFRPVCELPHGVGYSQFFKKCSKLVISVNQSDDLWLENDKEHQTNWKKCRIFKKSW